MPSQRAIFSFNHSLAWAEGLHQLLPVGLYVFLFTARFCRKARDVIYRDWNEGASGKDEEPRKGQLIRKRICTCYFCSLSLGNDLAQILLDLTLRSQRPFPLFA